MSMSDSQTRAQLKAVAQAAIDAADADLASGAIPEAEWQRRVTDALARSYLREDDPRWQSGFDGDAELWRQARSLILDAVPADGTLLDLGCANGHLMECLGAWARERGLKLTVYGLELNRALADAARSRLPGWVDRIFTGNVLDWQPPHRFDYVRTGLEYVAPNRGPALIARLLRELVAPEGRLIVGPVYERDIGHAVAAFAAAGVLASSVVRATDRNGKSRAVVWASRPSHEAPAA